jgi:hypothetical protein
MLTIPSHLLISPQALAEALAGDGDSPPDLARIPGMLAETQSHIESLIRQQHALIGADVDQLRALHATRNLLALMREAVGGDEIDAWRPHHLACAGGDLLVVVTREAHAVPPGAPMRVGTTGRRLGDETPPPSTWLELIGRALERLAGLGWGPQDTQAAHLVVEAILNQHEALDSLGGAVRPGDELTWLDLIDDALGDAQELPGFEGVADALAQAHSLVLKIRIGAAPLSDLLEACCLNPATDREGGGMA